MWHFTFYIFFRSEAFEIWCVLRTLVTLHSKAPMATIMDSGALDRLQVGTGCLWLLPTPCPLHSCICRQDSKHGMGQGVSPHSRLAYQGETSRSVSLNSPKRLPLNMGGLSCGKGWRRVWLFHLLWSKAGRKKVVQESLRETSSCVCFSTGSKYLGVCRHCPWLAHGQSLISRTALPLNPSATSESFSAPGCKQWQVNDCWRQRPIWRPDCTFFESRVASSFLCRAPTCSNGNSALKVFSLCSAACCSFLLGEEVKAPCVLTDGAAVAAPRVGLGCMSRNKKEWDFLKKEWRVRM